MLGILHSAILWVPALVISGLTVLAAMAGPAGRQSRLSQRAMWLGARRLPVWLINPRADRWVATGAAAFMVLLAGIAIGDWAWVSTRPAPSTVESTIAPVPPDMDASLSAQPDRVVDEELKQLIRANVPKTKRVSFLILAGETSRERVQFADQIRDYLKSAGYDVVSPYRYFLYSGATPQGLTIFPDEKNPEVWVLRVGLNDRK